jgi:hypothetical protein
MKLTLASHLLICSYFSASSAASPSPLKKEASGQTQAALPAPPHRSFSVVSTARNAQLHESAIRIWDDQWHSSPSLSHTQLHSISSSFSRGSRDSSRSSQTSIPAASPSPITNSAHVCADAISMGPCRRGHPVLLWWPWAPRAPTEAP